MSIAAIVTFKVLEKMQDVQLERMLELTGPLFASKQKKGSLNKAHIAMGCFSPGVLVEDSNLGLTLLFSGRLLGKSTIEKLLKRYGEIGEASFSELDGKFSFVLYDEKKKLTFAVRDRLGEMSLYWHVGKSHAYIASSIKAILATGTVAPSPDLTGIASSLGLGFISQDVTSIQEINRLLPGYFLKLSQDGSFSIQQYWSFSSTFARHYSQHFDTSYEIYCELERHIKEAVEKRSRERPAIISNTLGSQVIADSLKNSTQEIRKTVSPKEFLENLIPMVWSMEMPNAELKGVETLACVRECQKESRIPFFDTAFRAEFYDYSKEALDLFQTHYHVRRYEERTLSSKLAFKLFPKMHLEGIRRRQEATPQTAFLESALLMSPEEFAMGAPELSKYFDLDLFIHQFYHLPQIPKLDASLFYLTIKTFVTDGTSESRIRIADAYGVDSESPFMDCRLLEFFGSINPEVWASPDLISAFPKFWQENHPMEPTTPSTDIKALLLSEEVWPWLLGLERGMLVDIGFLRPAWIKRLLKSPKKYIHAIYAILILEVWMRLFVDLPLAASNKDLAINDILKK